MVSKANSRGKQLRWMVNSIWEEISAYWAIVASKAKSAATSAARMSDRGGLGPHTHLSGQKSFAQVEQEMIVELGRPVTLAEVFMRTHTNADRTFVDGKAPQVAQTYQKNKEAKMAEIETDTYLDPVSGIALLSIDEDNKIFLQSTYVNHRRNIYGTGSLESNINGKRKFPGSSSSILTLQKQLEDAQRKIEEQATLNKHQNRKIELL